MLGLKEKTIIVVLTSYHPLPCARFRGSYLKNAPPKPESFFRFHFMANHTQYKIQIAIILGPP